MTQHAYWETQCTLGTADGNAAVASNLAEPGQITLTVLHQGNAGVVNVDIVDKDANLLGSMTIGPWNLGVLVVNIPAGNFAAAIYLDGNMPTAVTMRIGPRNEDLNPPPPNPSQGPWWPKIPVNLEELRRIIPLISWGSPYYF